jgi:peptidoglycan/xylan/chitin deacetylase (PgdA/CDA1 family)
MYAVAEQFLAPVYRRLRRLKNRGLNLLDPPVIVLGYHRVTRLPSDPHQLAVTPENFREQMQYLRHHCRIVRLDADWSDLREPAVAVTFDDGYVDNLHQALPILAEAEVPATFFICTGPLSTRGEFWSDELEHLVRGEGDRPGTFVLDDREHGCRWPSAGRDERLALHDRLRGLMLKIPPQRRDTWLDQLRFWAGSDRMGRDAYRALTPAELCVLSASPLVTLGAHGVTHTPLAVLSEEEQREELAQSKHRLEVLSGRDVTVFAYPFGRREDYSRTTCRLCRETGFRRAVTTLPGQVHRWTDPLQIPRQLVRDWDARTFAARLERFWA